MFRKITAAVVLLAALGAAPTAAHAGRKWTAPAPVSAEAGNTWTYGVSAPTKGNTWT